jgi:uncharacterized protein (DUF1501 family)
MKRRDFLQIAPAATVALILNGLPVRTFASHPLLQLLAKQTQATGRVLVLIQLTGGNDGLNMVIPIDQYSNLSTARANILIPESKVLPLNGTHATGLHPAMAGIQGMYNNGLVNIVQGVSYPDPNFSHFRATDIWLTASDSTEYLNSGWVGRMLNDEYPNFPIGYPSATNPDPLAIEIGTAVSTALQGPNFSMGMAVTDINSFYNLINNTVTPAPATNAGHELTFLRYISQQTQQYTGVIQSAAAAAPANLSTLYPTGNSLADQLKIVARLIAGGLQTPIYMVSMGSFDTHVGQVDATDNTTGTHANLLKELSDGVNAFFDDCKLLGIDKRVAAMTFSEFGRRIISNGGAGTDHGTSEPVMVFGNGVNPGFIGTNPVIPQNAGVNDNLPMQNDYRSIYAAVLADWFQLPSSVMTDVLLQQFTVLPIFRKTNGVEETTVAGSDDLLGQNYPNPFKTSTTISFGTQGGATMIQLFDVSGRLVRTLVQQQYARGTYQITVNRDGLKAGNYFYRLITGNEQGTKQMVVVD